MNRLFSLLSLTTGLLLLTTHQVKAQGLPPCAKIFTPPDARQNPDSVARDTCIDSPTYDQLYARQWFAVKFDVHAIDLPWHPEGSIVDTTWDAIDPMYSTTRQGFDSLESTFGTFIMRKRFPYDTDDRRSQIFEIRFDSYVNVKSASAMLDAIAHVDGEYIQRLLILIDAVPVDVLEESESETFYVIPNPAEALVEVAVRNSGSYGEPIVLYDATGRQRIEAILQRPPERTLLDVSTLTAGAYYLRCGSSLTTLIVR